MKLHQIEAREREYKESQVKMAARLYECRDAVKSVYGDRYAERMAAYGQVIKSAANSMLCSEIVAATRLAAKSSGMAAVCYLAAVVEMTEPSGEAKP